MRCAIYTRKSSAEGLEAEFTSLDNQREYCSAYISSQRGEGWEELPQRYDDGGFSGGNLKRPALEQLRADIAAGHIDMVVVYKIDRLSRSLRDFANLVAEFEVCGVAFVSVTQSFNTGSAMGRLTLNVLLSFAQFERELTSERLRDFFAAAARRGRWIVGKRPFGYQVIEGRLVIDRGEAAIVRWIYKTYLRHKSIRRVRDEARRRRYRNRNGTPFTDVIVHRLLRNRVYRGERRGIPEQLHEPIVSEDLWQRVAKVLIDGRSGRRGRKHGSVRTCLLKGKLVDLNGRPCLPSGKGPNGTYRYYLDNPYKPDGPKPGLRMRVAEVDRSVVAMVDRLTGTTTEVARCRSAGETKTLIEKLVERVEIGHDSMTVQLVTGATITSSADGHLVRPIAKRWRLMSPNGERFEIFNLSLWLRNNAHLFDDVDLRPHEKSPTTCRAHIGLASLRPERTNKFSRRSWRGWRWDSGADL